MNHITSMTASELSDLLKEKEISSLELTEAFLHQIEQKVGLHDLYLSVTAFAVPALLSGKP